MSALRSAPSLADEAVETSPSEDCIVVVEDRSEAEVRFAENTPTTNGVRRDRRVTVIALKHHGDGMSTGVASRSGDVDVSELVAAANADAESSPPADDAVELLTASESPDAGGSSASRHDTSADLPETSLSIFQDVLSDLAGAFTRARHEKNALSGFAEHRLETLYLATSSGIRRRHVQPTGAMQLVARSTDGSRSAWAGVSTADFTDVSVEELEAQLIDRLSWGNRHVSLEAGRYETILPPAAVADLVVDLVEAMSGKETEEGRTAFSLPGGGTKVGRTLFPLPFEVRSDPNEVGLECQPFLSTTASSADVSVFDNGLDLARTSWVAQGRLERLRYHRAGAARAGVAPSAPIDNVTLELPGTTATMDDMIARTSRGLLLTCLWYIREVDPMTLLLTGLTRDGVFLIEDGEVVGAVNNFRFNESPVDLLARASEASVTQRTLGREFGEWVNRSAMPALRIPDFNMSSVSQAQ